MTVPPTPDGSVMLILGELRGGVQAITSRLDELRATAALNEDRALKRHTDLEGRVVVLENARLKLVAYATAAGSVGAWIVAQFGPQALILLGVQ